MPRGNITMGAGGAGVQGFGSVAPCQQSARGFRAIGRSLLDGHYCVATFTHESRHCNGRRWMDLGWRSADPVTRQFDVFDPVATTAACLPQCWVVTCSWARFSSSERISPWLNIEGSSHLRSKLKQYSLCSKQVGL